MVLLLLLGSPRVRRDVVPVAVYPRLKCVGRSRGKTIIIIFRWSPAAVENNVCRRDDGSSRTCLQRLRIGPLQTSSRKRKPRISTRTRPPVAVTSASLLPPTPSIPCFRCRRDSSRKVVPRSVGKLSPGQIRRQIRRRQLPEATALAPAAPYRRMMPAALVATSFGSGCVWPESPGQQVLVEEVVVSVELSTHDDAVRGIVALIFTVVRAGGVSCFYSSHWRSATHGPLVQSSR